ncbi:unnamed protein product [Caenorhabditis angaria]|uniref:Uncharacterized protein n=1 Tax=Caenorhabditis angaria TaxID=860376 RepID=A0A9P1N1K2_9PELO|nr:unnamed protein product [Caenorhabditis angaria]
MGWGTGGENDMSANSRITGGSFDEIVLVRHSGGCPKVRRQVYKSVDYAHSKQSSIRLTMRYIQTHSNVKIVFNAAYNNDLLLILDTISKQPICLEVDPPCGVLDPREAVL